MRSASPRVGLFIVLFAAAAAAVDHGPTSKVSATAWIPPTTPYGTPDLAGVWVNNRATPLERPKALEGRRLLTDAEVITLQQRADRLFKDGNSDFAAGDAVFLAAFANLDTYKNPDATADSLLSDDREFDNRTSLIVDPPDGRIPPLTAAARQKQAARAVARAAVRERDHLEPRDLPNALRCITWGVPRLIVTPFTDHYQIIQSPGYVVLDLETDVRIIPMDGRPHLRPGIRQRLGDSRGRWDGQTLVIDTTNFSSDSVFMGSNFMGSSEHLHLVERLTRVSPDGITYDVTVDDPTTWTRSWTVEIHLKRTKASLYQYACHEGNYEVMRSILAAARADYQRRVPLPPDVSELPSEGPDTPSTMHAPDGA